MKLTVYKVVEKVYNVKNEAFSKEEIAIHDMKDRMLCTEESFKLISKKGGKYAEMIKHSKEGRSN